jgi:hypothetical protein
MFDEATIRPLKAGNNEQFVGVRGATSALLSGA